MEAGISPVLIDIDTVDLKKPENENLGFVFASFQKIAKFTCLRDGQRYNNDGIACHTYIRTYGKGRLKELVTNFTGDTEGSDEVLNYITSKDGPFRKLMEIAPDKWKIFHKGGTKVAIGVPDEVLAYDCFPLVYAFLICSRIPSEWKSEARAFKKLLGAGMNPHQAHILARRLGVDNGRLVLSPLTWNGQHTHINEIANGFDFEMYCRGDHHSIADSTYTGNLWATAQGKYSRTTLGAFDLNVFTNRMKTTFTSVDYIPDENIPDLVKTFDKFMKERYGK